MHATYAELIRPAGRNRALAYDLGVCFAASVFVALLAQVAVGAPVPITGQTLGVLLAGAALGSRRGALAVAMYLAEGAAGLPVFAYGGFGLAHMLGPTSCRPRSWSAGSRSAAGTAAP